MYFKKIACWALMTISGYAQAQDPGELTARGAGYALVVAEKCSAKPEPIEAVTARQRNLFTSLQKAGHDFESIKRGYLTGVMLAESRFPAGSKPSRKECADAQKIKGELAKL